MQEDKQREPLSSIPSLHYVHVVPLVEHILHGGVQANNKNIYQ